MTSNQTCIELPYGDRRITVHLPPANLLGVFASRPSQATQTAETLIAEALARPIGAPRLSRLARPGARGDRVRR